MHIIGLGLNHTTAPLDLREKLALDDDIARIALAGLACGHVATPLTELILISTCNRIELYAISSQLAFADLEMFLSEVGDMPVDQFTPHLYRFTDTDAVRHLFEVAAGLDSLVIGEPQILGQVTRALELARMVHHADARLRGEVFELDRARNVGRAKGRDKQRHEHHVRDVGAEPARPRSLPHWLLHRSCRLVSTRFEGSYESSISF